MFLRGEILIPRRAFQFGTFSLDARTGELTSEGRPIHVRGQAVELLTALLERPGELVTRQELATRLWPPGTFVDIDRGLNKSINHLREALGDSSEAPQYVETLPRRGYRFIAPVTVVANDDAGLPNSAQPVPLEVVSTSGTNAARGGLRLVIWLAIAAAAGLIVLFVLDIGAVRTHLLRRWAGSPSIGSIAVLPLENLSSDPDHEYFADGMTDALITDLAKVGGLRVTSRTSVMRYKNTSKTIRDVGRELDVDAIVEGTVVRVGDRVRINAQLIQVATDTHLWAEAYERDLTEVLALQRALATDIVRQVSLVVKVPAPPRRVDARAYGLFLKGRYLFHQYTDSGWREAIDAFTQSAATDPTFAPAFAGLAETFMVAGAYDARPSEDALARSEKAAVRALELDDTLGSAHYVLATARAWYRADWPAAEQEFQRALALDPDNPMGRNWYGGYLSLRGRHDEAIAEHVRAQELDPQLAITRANLVRAYYWARRYDDAIAQASRTLERDRGFGVALFWLEGALRRTGRLKEAVELRLRSTPPERAAATARLFAAAGFDAVLRQDAERLQSEGVLVPAARCFAQLGEKERAISLLEACAARRCPMLVTIGTEPDLDPLRDDVRFVVLLQGIGLK